MTVEELIAFEADVAQAFNNGQIKAPLHLAGGNERQLIELFAKSIRPDDYVCSTWRSHFHCLLKGVPRETVKAAILDGRSIALCFPEYKVISSALVGGIAPIAVGLAWGIKKRGGSERVWCFLGDMAERTGIVYEAMNYASGHDLPVQWVIEDNGQGSGADTKAVWGYGTKRVVVRYEYVLPHRHVGTGRFVSL